MFLDISELRILLSLITALLITWFSIPSIIRVARLKHLFDEPGKRTSHTTNVPTLGGLAIFAGLMIGLLLWVDVSHLIQLPYFVGAIVIVFFIGIKDDILVIAPMTKLVGLLGAAAVIVFFGDLRFTSLHGFYGFMDIPYYVSTSLTIFIIIVITNGFNLIDGINGLSSGVGITTSATFGIWFWLVGESEMAVLSAALCGSLAGFFRFNVFSQDKKIFMGDTGSLILGFVISILVIKFNELNINSEIQYSVHAAPSVSFGVLIVPLFDTLRVMFIRIITRRSPFSADRNHVHHRLLDLGFSHTLATFTIISVNLIFIGFVFIYQELEILRMTLLLLILAMIISYIPVFIIERKASHEKKP